MQNAHSDIQQLARAHHYSIHPFALRRLEKFLRESASDTSGRRKLLSDLFTRVREQGARDRVIDEASVGTAIQSLNNQLQHTSANDGLAAVQVVHIHQTPNIGVHEVTEELVTLPANYRTDRLGAFRQRYLLALRRCQRSGIFALSSKTATNDAQVLPLLPVSSLEGRPATERVAVLGMLVEHQDGVHIEDMHGHAPLDMSLTSLREGCVQGFVGSGFLVVITGVWRSDKLHVQKLALPPAEPRERTVRDHGGGDLFGLAPADLAVAQEARANALHSVIIFLAHVHLDRAATLSQLGSFFASMQNRSEREHASTTYCLIGNFSSMPLSYGDASHLPDSFSTTTMSTGSNNNGGTDCLRDMLETLGRCIAASAPAAAQLSHFILIPGPHDAASLQGVFPQPPFTKYFAKGIMNSVKTLSLAPNPCRLRFYNHEIVVSRRDYLRTFRASEGKLVQCLRSDLMSTSGFGYVKEQSGYGYPIKNSRANGTDANIINNNSSTLTNSVAELSTSFERITKTVVDEAHLAPDAETPILWKSDKALRLAALPHTLLLCDSTEQWECFYKGMRVVNPGSFAVSTTFLWYTPADVSVMKRGRDVYTEKEDVRLAKVHSFIKNLKLSVPLYKLRTQQTRGTCPRCSKRRLYYCYDCLTVIHPDTHPPPLALPIRVYVLLHSGELRSKSTSLAASTISPDIHIVPYPEVPTELRPEDTLVLYPSQDSVALNEVVDLASYKNVVFVESTWQQSKAIIGDRRVSKFRHVRIKSQSSLFWRFQNNNPSYLATVEAIYYFLREYIVQSRRLCVEKTLTRHGATTMTSSNDNSSSGMSTAVVPTDDTLHDSVLYRGEVDDLLLYYVNQYIAIQQKYSHDATAKYTDRHFTGYILKSLDWDNLVSTPYAERACVPQLQSAQASSTGEMKEEVVPALNL